MKKRRKNSKLKIGLTYSLLMRNKFRDENQEKELRKQKEAYTRTRLEQIKEQERDLLDTRS